MGENDTSQFISARNTMQTSINQIDVQSRITRISLKKLATKISELQSQPTVDIPALRRYTKMANKTYELYAQLQEKIAELSHCDLLTTLDVANENTLKVLDQLSFDTTKLAEQLVTARERAKRTIETAEAIQSTANIINTVDNEEENLNTEVSKMFNTSQQPPEYTPTVRTKPRRVAVVDA